MGLSVRRMTDLCEVFDGLALVPTALRRATGCFASSIPVHPMPRIPNGIDNRRHTRYAKNKCLFTHSDCMILSLAGVPDEPA